MKLIIDIPENVYKASQIIGVKYEDTIQIPLEVIANGTPPDKIRAEIEETYMNITYQENKDRKATWGLRKALEIINKYMAESENA